MPPTADKLRVQKIRTFRVRSGYDFIAFTRERTCGTDPNGSAFLAYPKNTIPFPKRNGSMRIRVNEKAYRNLFGN